MVRLLLPVALLASLAAAGGCSTPTLPLPPPAALSATPPDASGIVTVEGDVLENAYVFCLNDRTERGVIVVADGTGHFTLQIEAMSGDGLMVWQELGRDLGEPGEIVVP